MKFFVVAWFIPVLLCTAALAEKSSDSKQGSEDNAPVVSLSQGKLKGLTRISRKGNQYNVFLGIPYAKAPVRFGPSQPADPWDGVKLATKHAPHCFQYCLIEQRLVGIEDCLTLDIYTPKLSEDSSNLPVMVLLHGGGFQFGSGSYVNGKYLVDENIILVTLQYRMGALGFLNLGDDDTVLGNNGLRDQSTALKWIQDNIHLFGGDKTQVTIFGFSAGGASVHYQMLSPMSRGLFSRGISQSGSALNPWAFQSKPKELAFRLGQNVGCTQESSQELVQCLRKKTPAEIVTGQLKLSVHPHEFDLISMLFCPSVETGDHEPKFLPDTPYKIITNGKTASKVPWIAGVTHDEGAFYTANSKTLPFKIEEKILPNGSYVFSSNSVPHQHAIYMVRGEKWKSPNNIPVHYRLLPYISVMKTADDWLKTIPEVSYMCQDKQVPYVGYQLSRCTSYQMQIDISLNRNFDNRKWKHFDSFVQQEINVHLLENEKSMKYMNTNFNKMLPNILYFENSANSVTQGRISAQVREFYFKDKKIEVNDYLKLGQVFGDRFFVVGVSRAIREHAKKADFPVYPYIFNHTSPQSITQGMLYTKGNYGVAHADDLKYLFSKAFGSPDLELNSPEGQFSEKFVKLLVSFAKDGEPTSLWGSVSKLEPYKNEEGYPLPWFVIDDETKVVTEDPFKERTDFWENLPLRELEKEDDPDEKDEL